MDLGLGVPAILYVDDEPKSVKYFLRAFGADFQVLTAASVAEAEDLLVRHQAGIGVLVTDQRMPVETGLQLLLRVKERHPAIVRLLTTAYADLGDAMAAVNRGAIHRYILKPWDLESLRADLHAAMQLHRQRQLDRELLQARRQTMTALASHMAHELATPLATIASAATGLDRHLPALVEVYRRVGPGPGEAGAIPPAALEVLGDAAAIVRKSAERSRMLVQLLLMNAGFGGQERTVREELSAARLVEEALGGFPFAPGDQDLIEFQGGDFALLGSQTLLIHVLYNLIRNALDAVRSAGKGAISLVAEAGLPWNRLMVSDTGIGIPAQALPFIFDEFFSLKGPGLGTGMGLPFCRRVMTDLGGEIVCHSIPGGYTRLELRFPSINDDLGLDPAPTQEQR